MNWSTRRQMLRVYLKDHNWWWKWPFIVTALAVWVGALVLLVAPWDRAGSEQHVVGPPVSTTPDLMPLDGATDPVTSWSGGDNESSHRRTTGVTPPIVEAPAERIAPETEPTTAEADAIGRSVEAAAAAELLEVPRGDVAEAPDPPAGTSAPPSATATNPTATGPTTTGATPSTTGSTTTAPASQPTLDTPGPEAGSTTTIQPTVVDDTATATTTKATGKPSWSDPTDGDDLADTKGGKVRRGQKTDKNKD